MDRPDYTSTDHSSLELIERDFCLSHEHSVMRRLRRGITVQRRRALARDAAGVVAAVAVIMTVLLFLKIVFGA